MMGRKKKRMRMMKKKKQLIQKQKTVKILISRSALFVVHYLVLSVPVPLFSFVDHYTRSFATSNIE
jgi:membrane-anchored glycerophosphoryl diester phosphodiesterase (GDPDase)